LRVFIGQLRRKVEADPDRPSLIVTEPGVGYRLQDE
jgi:two-component system KDP operon response regulator KdpE